MGQKVVVKEETVRQWIRGIMSSNLKLNEVGLFPDEADIDLKATASRRMPQYRGKSESRPTPRTTKSSAGTEDAKLKDVQAHLSDEKVKIGDRTFKSLSDSDAKEEKALEVELRTELIRRKKAGLGIDAKLQAKIDRFKELKQNREEYETFTPSSGAEFTEEELPVKGYGLKTVQGVLLDTKKSYDKMQLAKVVPEYVIQMFIKATKDYKAQLQDAMKVVRASARDYIAELKQDMSSSAASEIGLSPDEVNLTPEEIDELSSNEGMALVTGSSQFKAWFERWIKGSYQAKDGSSYEGAPPKIAKMVQANVIPMTSLKSAIGIASKLRTFDVLDDTPSSLDVAAELGLNSKSEWDLTRVDAFLMLHDPYFRYFVDGKGTGKGSQVHYWDWVRNHAEKLGHRTQF
jgi:hypothetical protein